MFLARPPSNETEIDVKQWLEQDTAGDKWHAAVLRARGR